MNKKMIIPFLFIFTFIINTLSNAACPVNSDFWKTDKQGRGWFWKEECQELDENLTDNLTSIDNTSKYKILPNKQEIPWDIIDTVDPDEIAKVIEPIARKVAITYPTTENITEYRKLSIWMTNKTTTFARLDEETRINNPNELMAGLMNSNTGSHFQSSAALSIHLEAKNNEMARFSKIAGLLVFVSPTCKFCEKQIPVLDNFKSKYGFDYVTNDISTKPELVAKLGIETTPDIFLAINKNGSTKYQRIATGLHSFADLENAVLKGLKYMGENIDENAIY